MTLYIATSNPGKLRDFNIAAATFNITTLPLPGLQDIPAPEEDQPTFAGNAILKARFYAAYAPGHIVLADDSGLEVDSLEGAPGVRSARYASDVALRNPDQTFPSTPNATPDDRNNAALLRAMDRNPAESSETRSKAGRHARYRCVLAAARSNQGEAGEILHTADGTVEGTILTSPQGTGGFGYDSLFYLPEHNLTMAQLDPVTRLGLSHRGRALAALLLLLQPA
jgi:XTP/dITP diphosphohydrolase